MTDDRLGVLLRELPVPSAASARERVVTAAREHIEARAGATRPRPPLRSRRHFALVLAACFSCLAVKTGLPQANARGAAQAPVIRAELRVLRRVCH